jgi:hypothetical protein
MINDLNAVALTQIVHGSIAALQTKKEYHNL